jgi:molecular chaperone DnaJ
VNVNVSLQDIYNEKVGKINYTKRIPCQHCNGTGAENGKIKQCTVCNGTGTITKTQVHGNSMFTSQSLCQACGGKGHIIETPCKKCNGKGLENSKATVEFTIPKGVFDGARMLMEGYGDLPKTGNGIPGNLIVVFHIVSDDYFKVVNGCLVHEENVPITDCLLGCKRTIKTINGEERVIDLPELTEQGKHYTFEDVGMWNQPYVVVINYQMPNKLTEKQKDLLSKFKDEDKV